MAKKSSQDASTAPLALEADLRIGAAPALRDTLLSALHAGAAIQLDGSAVAQLDAAGLQVLAAFSRDARTASVPVACVGASDTLRRGVTVLGLDALIELPAAAGVN